MSKSSTLDISVFTHVIWSRQPETIGQEAQPNT